MANKELKVYNMEGKQVGTVEVNGDIFDVEYNAAVIHQVVVAQLANKRQGTKSALTRTEVSGGGKKPYRQKGTGRARQGSTRAPQWRKGGVVFAPKPRDFSKKVNKKMKDLAFKVAISQKIRAEELVVVQDMAIAEAKTKLVAKALDNLGATAKTLLVLDDANDTITRASRNIEGLTTCEASLVNVYDLVRNGKCIITEKALKAIEEVNQ